MQAEDRRRFLLKYVQEVEPELMEQFAEVAPFQVGPALQQLPCACTGSNLHCACGRRHGFHCECSPHITPAASLPCSWPQLVRASPQSCTTAAGARLEDFLHLRLQALTCVCTAYELEYSNLPAELHSAKQSTVPDRLQCWCLLVQVVDAMRETIARMLGTLPPQFFQVTVSTSSAEDLAQLFYSVMMTGYMFRNAQCRLELRRKMDYQLPAGAPPATRPGSCSCRYRQAAGSAPRQVIKAC